MNTEKAPTSAARKKCHLIIWFIIWVLFAAGIILHFVMPEREGIMLCHLAMAIFSLDRTACVWQSDRSNAVFSLILGIAWLGLFCLKLFA